MTFFNTINNILLVLFLVCYSYQFIYFVTPFIKKNAEFTTDKINNFAVLICARNEGAVIQNLIQSLKEQNYPQDKLTVFVMADNCTDNTAMMAKKAGAVVYKRYNKTLIGKGYALNELLNNIKNDYNDFDGYFVFDADNIVDKDFVKNMNATFSNGYEVVTGFRNSKNYGDNWISAGHSLWFLRECHFINNSRMLLNTSCNVSGTGFLVSSKILENLGGWNYHLLTEDVEFSIDNILLGENIGYCEKAVFYDEQPTSLEQSYNQRLRWSKGFYQVYSKYGVDLIKGIFKGSFACYDFTMYIIPAIVLSGVGFITNISYITFIYLLTNSLAIAIKLLVSAFISSYIGIFLMAAVTTFVLRKSIYCSWYKKIFYCFTFPFYLYTYMPIGVIAIFKQVEWREIKHVKAKTLKEIMQ